MVNGKKILLLAMCLAYVFSSIGRETRFLQIIDEEKETISKIVTSVEKDFKTLSNYTEKSGEIFQEAFGRYQDEFGDYLNITALNVTFDREEITLPGFDIDYEAPSYSDIMYDYQTNLEASLDAESLQNYESLRKSSYDFDRYASLNAAKYDTLSPTLKYTHTTSSSGSGSGIGGGTGIIPGGGTTIKPNPIKVSSSTATTTTLIAILIGAGLTEVVATAFEAAFVAVGVGASTATLPIVGWALAVAIVVGALIALTVIIVQNWALIQTVIGEIKDYFLSQFEQFSSLVNSFFDDAITKCNESTVADRKEIGGEEIVFRGDSVPVDTALTLTKELYKNKDMVFLMKNVSHEFASNGNAYVHFWYSYALFDQVFVIENKLYDYGMSTYTWSETDAIDMLWLGSTVLSECSDGGFGVIKHKYLDTEKNSLNGWDHYHIGKRIGGTDDSPAYMPYKILNYYNVHSFFGVMYLREKPGGDNYSTYPEGAV